ncbi:hypothetical protein Acid7E03_43960 [Acidisoma sp. 7E03]
MRVPGRYECPSTRSYPSDTTPYFHFEIAATGKDELMKRMYMTSDFSRVITCGDTNRAHVRPSRFITKCNAVLDAVYECGVVEYPLLNSQHEIGYACLGSVGDILV